jgi:hypothetical protein
MIQFKERAVNPAIASEVVVVKKRKNKVYSPNWGGKRTPGPGKRIGGVHVENPLVRKTVTLPSEMIDTFRAMGDGNLSAGIRKMYKEHGVVQVEVK